MVGTDNGVVYICNKRFKTPADRIYSRVQCYNGVVSAVQRNPSFLKFFLSVGDWQAKVNFNIQMELILMLLSIKKIIKYRFGAKN
jgi:hypothetical protein